MADPKDIRENYRRTLDTLTRDRKMHPEAKRVEAARLYARTRAQLQHALAEQRAAEEQRWGALERKLWGHDDAHALAPTPADRATVTIAARDALDRAAQLKKPEDAARLLRQAEQTGDELLARAVAQRANDRDWDDVLGTYLQRRPTAAQAYDEMCQIYQRRTTAGRLADGMAHMVAKPQELQGMSDKEIQQMAGDTDALA